MADDEAAPEEAPAEEAPAEEAPPEEAPAEEAPAEEAPPDEAPAEGAPAEAPAETPAEAPAEVPPEQLAEPLSEEEPLPPGDDSAAPAGAPAPAADAPAGKAKEDDSICSSSSDSEDMKAALKKRPSQYYAEMLLKIVSQNKIIMSLKEKIKDKCAKCPRSGCEEREIFNLKVCLEQENLKLQTLVRCAISIQSKDPDRKWPPIPLETTWDEDRMPISLDYRSMTSRFGALSGVCDKKPKRAERGDFRCSSSETTTSESPSEDSCAKLLRCKPSKPKGRGGNKELARSYNMQEKLVADNADLEGDRYKLQEELLSRDRMIECLQQKVCLMHAELSKICRQTHGLDKKEEKSICDQLPKLQTRLKDQGSATKCLSNAMDRIQNALDGLKLEVDAVKKSKDRGSSRCATPRKGPSRAESCGGGGGGRNEFQDLKQRYCELLEDYACKERELCSLKNKMNAFIDGKPEKDSNETHEAEVRLLRQKLKECREEQDEFKVIICEQAKQTDEYREKYMAALQKIEELKCILQKMEVDNKRVEDQINLEIQRIKSKFQEKLQDWAHLPKMLENEQVKLAQCCKEKEDLEAKLRVVCRELKALKSQKSAAGEEKDDPDKLRRLEQELADLKAQHEALLEAKNRICEKYEQLKREMGCLRQESAKIICRLKERSQATQATLQKHIDELEHELAQCRATACLSVADREEVIKDMQSQLNCLGLSFDSAQKQIKSLKDHISYLSSGKAKSVVICCQNDNA